MLSYELGHLNLVAELFKKHERRDPKRSSAYSLPEPIPFESQREFVRATLAREVDLRASGDRTSSTRSRNRKARSTIAIT